jgi:hypothetical protein
VLLFEYKFVSCTLGVSEPAELAFYGPKEEFLYRKMAAQYEFRQGEMPVDA